MQSLKQWLGSEEFKDVKGKSEGDRFALDFFRDPERRTYVMPDVFYAPADGVVLYAHEKVGPKEAIVEVKGKKFTVQDLLDDKEYDLPSLVVGIFMTQYDVHVNRMPTKGFFSEVHRTPYLFTPNISMLLEEQELVDNGTVDPSDMEYLFQNERRVSRVKGGPTGEYYLVQIADLDVDVICNWSRNKFYHQGERFGMIRFGSQVDLVIPMLEGCPKLEVLVKPKHHVEGGIDPLVRVCV